MQTDYYYLEHLKTNATTRELCEILGENWAICRKTPANLARYVHCVTRKEYEAANKLAISRRKSPSREGN